MRVLHVTASLSGGAGIAARRSVEALRMADIDAQLLTGGELKTGGAWRARWDKVPLLAYPRRAVFSTWSNGWWPGQVAARINAHQADVVHLHWVGHGFLGLAGFAEIRMPLVWSMHDLWAFTGGCHYPSGCNRFVSGCGACPQLASSVGRDLSRWNQGRKKKLVIPAVQRWIAPSDWIAGVAQQSGLVLPDQVRVIPNTLELDIYHPDRRAEARRQRGIAEGELVLAVGSFELDEPRKGNHLLPEVLSAWRRMHRSGQARLIVFGAKKPPDIQVEGLRVEQAGRLDKPSAVADVLAAADVFLLPSLQDNLPNVALEAQACGCPVVGFNAGGLREIVEPGRTGMIAVPQTAQALGEALAELTIRGPKLRREMAVVCRSRAEALFATEAHANALLAVYREVIA